jgi:hypothetical protein
LISEIEDSLGKSLIKIFITTLVISAVLYRLADTDADYDLWGYLTFGRLFWQTGHFPYEDIFSFVPTLHPWVYHEWLTGVIFYPIYQSVGTSGLLILKYVLGLSTVGFIYLTARKRGATPLAAVLGLLIIHNFLRMGYSPVRAQVFTYFFFALTFFLLERARISGHFSGLWFLLPIQIIWCNLHGGFPAGLGLIFIYAMGEAISRQPSRMYWTVFCLSGAATLINPYGLDYWNYMFRAIALPRPEISEWVSVFQAYRSGLIGWGLVYFILMSMFAAFWWVRKREITAGLALAFTLYIGWKHLRHQMFFLLLMGAYLPDLFTIYFHDLKSRPSFMAGLRRLNWQIPVAAGMLLIVLNSYWLWRSAPLNLKIPPLPKAGSAASYYPLGALDYIRTHNLSGKLLVKFDWGEFLIWNLYPQCRIALDGRFETVYSIKISKEYFDFLFGRPNWHQFLIKYSPDFILIDSRTRTYNLINEDPQWRQVYTDPGCALFLRK